MLNYGGMAQTLWNYNTDLMANEGVDYTMSGATAADIECPDFNADALNNAVSQYGLEWLGSTLVLKTNTSLRLYFKVTDENQANSLTSAKVNGKDVNVLSNSNGKYIEITGIAAQDIGNTWTFAIGDYQFQYSPLNYIKSHIDDDNDLGNVVKALYDYHIYAKAYFNKA